MNVSTFDGKGHPRATFFSDWPSASFKCRKFERGRQTPHASPQALACSCQGTSLHPQEGFCSSVGRKTKQATPLN